MLLILGTAGVLHSGTAGLIKDLNPLAIRRGTKCISLSLLRHSWNKEGVSLSQTGREMKFYHTFPKCTPPQIPTSIGADYCVDEGTCLVLKL